MGSRAGDRWVVSQLCPQTCRPTHHVPLPVDLPAFGLQPSPTGSVRHPDLVTLIPGLVTLIPGLESPQQ